MSVPITGFPEDFDQADVEIQELETGCMWEGGAGDRPCCYIKNFTCGGCPYNEVIYPTLEIFVARCSICRRPIACDAVPGGGIIENENFVLWGDPVCRHCDDDLNRHLECDMEGTIFIIGIGPLRRMKNSTRAACAHFLGEPEASFEWSIGDVK